MKGTFDFVGKGFNAFTQKLSLAPNPDTSEADISATEIEMGSQKKSRNLPIATIKAHSTFRAREQPKLF